ncbi:MAG: pirin family protein [Thermoplasmata archaeon]|nr:pirin family protein [Thermoplasmata archaeon]
MSASDRKVVQKFGGSETLEGAGVRLRRMFGNGEVPLLDPFLLLDNFGSSNPVDYLAGFPWHPHRGIETVTYMLNGNVEHEDSLGNSGVIGGGEVQWMSAGSGILHQEMPKRIEGTMSGFQLWVNLPRRLKMEVPSYRGLRADDIPVVRREDESVVKVVAGEFNGVEGPVRGIPVDPTYLDVQLPAGIAIRLPTRRGHTAFAQAISGSGAFGPPRSKDPPTTLRPGETPESSGATRAGETSLFDDGDAVEARAGDEGLRFLFVTGRPLREPVAWYGPIVMNTREEILEARRDLERGTFIRSQKVINEI